MPLRTIRETFVYQGQGEKEELLPRRCYKETRTLPINTVTFFNLEAS